MEDKMKFICDQMLGRLARWLRFMGYDAEYLKERDDKDLLKYARESERILLTRDKELKNRRSDAKIILIKSSEIDQQIAQVVQDLGMRIEAEKILSRCAVCGADLEDIPKDEVGGYVPEGVFERNEKFWRCPKCRRIYWAGSHYKMIMEKLKGISNQ